VKLREVFGLIPFLIPFGGIVFAIGWTIGFIEHAVNVIPYQSLHPISAYIAFIGLLMITVGAVCFGIDRLKPCK